MRLIQYLDPQGRPRVGKVDDAGTRVLGVDGYSSTYELAQAAIEKGLTLEALIQSGDSQSDEPYAPLLASARLLPPLAHPDPAHCHVSGTGLTHLGSATTRDAMHLAAQTKAESTLTDSMRMFRWGVEGGRPTDGKPGAQPEWFYKGNGNVLVACGQPIVAPDFALDFGEEPEVVGLYVIAPDGRPVRLGYAIGNEFSDHVTERQNYLYLAHSKLRQCGVGPELRTGVLPAHLEGHSRIRRGETVRWEKPFLTGEANMCHTLANLEFHHFKYAAHRVPGDVHLHFFGTATLSFADGVRVEAGEQFEIDLPALGAPLVNTLAVAAGGFSFDGVQAL
ncbi:MAG TPA: AraD1 family protein [Steroidobacteraceae bacterium]|nr:AraD1 family protein [Steroidobacteraceae bacterium]